jgi:hypothetical protein
MICYRRACLSIALLCFCAAIASTAWAQNPPAPQQPPPAPPTQEKKPQNPFETVPETPEQTKPGETQQAPLWKLPNPRNSPKRSPAGK